MVDELLELRSPFLEGRNSAFPASIATFHKINIANSDNDGPNYENFIS